MLLSIRGYSFAQFPATFRKKTLDRFKPQSVRSSLIDSPASKNTKDFRDRDRRDLTIFVIDTSYPAGGLRIDAVKGAIGNTLPRERVAVITCSDSSAELCIEPTNSLVHASRKLSLIRKSVMGNLGAGLSKALDVVQQEISLGTRQITVAIIADSKAHGLVSGTLDCLEKSNSQCNIELLVSATAIADAKSKADNGKQNVRMVVIDTESDFLMNKKTQVHEEGAILASVIHGSYYHYPDLSQWSLLRVLKAIKS